MDVSSEEGGRREEKMGKTKWGRSLIAFPRKESIERSARKEITEI